MAKLQVLLNTVVISTSLTEEVIKDVQKFNPVALKVVEKIEGEYEDTIYEIGLGSGTVGNFSTAFKKHGDKLVASTTLTPASGDSMIKTVREELIGPMTYIKKIEEQVTAAYEEIKTSLDSFEAEIEILEV